jgi:hypothetical protein
MKSLFAAIALLSASPEPLPLHGIYACSTPDGSAFTIVYDVPTGKGAINDAWNATMGHAEYAVAMGADGIVHMMHTTTIGVWDDMLKPDGTFTVQNVSTPNVKAASARCVRKR